MFQFLIGRLRPRHREIELLTLNRFQFLIGRLRTSSPARASRAVSTFQFLIGRLRTILDRLNRALLRGFNSS